MIEDKVISYFSRFPDLRILFFFDETGEYREEVQNLNIPDIHTEYWENNPFSLKCKLTDDLRDTKVLLYLPMAMPADKEAYQNFPLMGLLLANKELQLDNVGELMENYGLHRSQKALVTRYMSELKYSGVQEVCKPILTAGKLNEPLLQKGLLAAFLKFKNIESWSLQVAKLITLAHLADQSELQRVTNKVTGLNFESEVIRHIMEVTGVSVQKISRDNLIQVAQSILYNKLTQTIPVAKSSDPYAAFKITDSTKLTRLNQMLHEVDRNTQLKPAFDSLLQSVSKDIRGEKLIEIYGEEADFAELNTEMIWAVLNKIHAHIATAPAEVIKKIELISLQSSIENEVKNTLKYMVQIAKMHLGINAVGSYILDTPEEYITAYTQDWYKIDTAYRRAVSLYKNLDPSEIPADIDLDKIHQDLNITYEKHTDLLNREWLKCLHHFNFDYSKIKAPKQYDFYNAEIDPAEQKVVVIISDALRYEAAYELLAEMHSDAKNTAEMRYMLASIPSKTNIGMAQLLPGNEKTFNNGNIISDGISISGTDNRTKILQAYNLHAQAYQYSNIEGLDQTARREIFKKPVVYIYHDVIDSTGDKKPSERRTFEAVKDAVDELKLFIKKLHSSYNVTKVLITADHGFLYTDREIEEKGLEQLPTLDIVQSHNRYYLSLENSSVDLGYTFPLSATTVLKEELFVTVPYSINRYRKQGVGHQFVHGGGSLQELIVPLIESSRKREVVTKKVTPLIINKGALKVVSNILKLNILQEQEVSRTHKERILNIGLYNNLTLVSNEEEVALNFTSEAPSERMLRIELLLAADAANEAFLKLKIFDSEDKLNPLIEERIQNNTLIQTDF